MQPLDRWVQINQEIQSLKNELYYLKERLIKEFIESCNEIFTLPFDATLNWRQPVIVVVTDQNNQPAVELREVESPRLLNGCNSKSHKAGTTFLVLKAWKTGKNTKGTHYLLYDKKKKLVANFYG